jgi:hypothetical protein
MGERFSISYSQAYPLDPRGWASSEFNSRQGLSYAVIPLTDSQPDLLGQEAIDFFLR